MKINLTPRLTPRRGEPVRVGNVYSTKMGPNGYFLVVGVVRRDGDRPWNNVVLLRFDQAGQVTRGSNEPEAYVQDHKDLIGFVENMPDIIVKWDSES